MPKVIGSNAFDFPARQIQRPNVRRVLEHLARNFQNRIVGQAEDFNFRQVLKRCYGQRAVESQNKSKENELIGVVGPKRDEDKKGIFGNWK